MSFLVISGLPIEVLDGMQAATDDMVGEHFRTETGALRSTVQRHLRAWTLRTVPLTEEQTDFLRSWAPHGQEQVCSGAFLGGDGTRAVVCQVLYSADAYTPDNTGYLRELTITLRQKWRIGVLAPDGTVEYPAESGSGVTDPATFPGSENHVLVDLPDDHDQAPVARKPLPRFLIDPPAGHRETLFTLDATNTVAGQDAQFLWDFGDGTRAEGATVTHRYWRDGTFQVTLRVVDEFGAEVVYGVVTVTSTLAPTPGFRMDPGGRNRRGTNIRFTSTATGLAPLFVEWDLGDGVQTVGDEVSHEYSANGTFTLRQRITDAYGAVAEIRAPIEVGDEPGVLSAAFVVAPQAGPTGTVFSLDASEARGEIDTYAWDLGDGNAAQGMTASHAYSADGVYTVTLLVTTADGASAQASRTVTVAPAAAPAAPFISAESVQQTSVELAGTVFEDANPGSMHAASQWQVSATGNFSGVLIHDSGEDSPDLVRHEVPGLTLATVYHARARYRDDSGQWSLWSETLQFATLSGEELPAEPDEPGIPGDEESGGEPGSGGEDAELPPDDEEEAEEGAPGRPVLSIGNKGEDDVLADRFVQMALSDFQPGGAEGETHHSSRWQLARDDGFQNVSYDSGWDINYKDARTVQHLAGETTYYARGAHKSSTGKLSEWSAGVSFKTSRTPTADGTEIWRILDSDEPGLCVAHYDMRFRSRLGADQEIILVEDPRRERRDIPPLRSIMPGQGPELKLDFPENYEIMPWAEPYRVADFAVDKILTTGPSQYLKDQLGGECAIVIIARCKGGGASAVLAQLLQGDPGGNKNQLLLTYDFGEDGITARTPNQAGAEATVTQEKARIKTAKRRLMHAFRSEHNVGVFVATTSTTSYELAAEGTTTTTTTNPDGTTTTTTTTGLDLGSGADVTRLTVGPVTGGGAADFEWSAITVLKHPPSAETLDKIKAWAVAKHHVDLSVEEEPEIPELELVTATHNSVTVKLKEFVDANGGTHKQTEWQLSESENFDVLVAGGWYPFIDPNAEDPVEGPPPEIPAEEDAKKTQIEMPDLTAKTPYFVRARVKDSSDAISEWSEILDVATLPQPAVPDFAWSGTQAGSATVFTNQTIADPSLELTYAWTLGDSGTSDVASPQHTYAAAGTYQAKLSVTDQHGRTVSITKELVITPGVEVYGRLARITKGHVGPGGDGYARADAAVLGGGWSKVMGHDIGISDGRAFIQKGALAWPNLTVWKAPFGLSATEWYLSGSPDAFGQHGYAFAADAGWTRFYVLRDQGGSSGRYDLLKYQNGVLTTVKSSFGNGGDWKGLHLSGTLLKLVGPSMVTPASGIELEFTGDGVGICTDFNGGFASWTSYWHFTTITKSPTVRITGLPAGSSVVLSALYTLGERTINTPAGGEVLSSHPSGARAERWDTIKVYSGANGSGTLLAQATPTAPSGYPGVFTGDHWTFT